MALHSQGSPTDVLGVRIDAPEEYAPSILVPIPRAKGRGLLGLAEGNLLPFAGECQALRVTGRFFRRGGIDINPVRTMGAEDIDAAIGTAPPQLRVPGQ